jgi:hypothetical protein
MDLCLNKITQQIFSYFDVALQQIENKKYETVLLQRGVKKETIVNYGIAFYEKKSA